MASNDPRVQCPGSILGFSILIFMSNLPIVGRRKFPCFQLQAKSISSVMTVLLGAVLLLLYPSGVRTSDLMGFEKHSSGILFIKGPKGCPYERKTTEDT